MSDMKMCPKAGLRAANEVRWEFIHEPESGVTLEDVCKPGYWRDVWRHLASGKHAKIECIAKDQSWEATLRVFATGDGYAKVRVLGEPWVAAKASGRKPSLPKGFEVSFVDGTGWRVRNADGEIVVSGYVTEGEAIKAANDLADKVAA